MGRLELVTETQAVAVFEQRFEKSYKRPSLWVQYLHMVDVINLLKLFICF